MGIFDKAKGAVKNYTDGLKEQEKGIFDKAKGAVKNYTDGLKEQEAKNNELAAASMEERIKMRPDGVRYCLANNLGKILDVYENKVVFKVVCC